MKIDCKGNTLFDTLGGKTIAVVYMFENELMQGLDHYWIWRSDIISGWLKAIQELQCVPYVLDIRTFSQKAFDHSLPKIDFVINLNCGCTELSSLALVPSICSVIGVPCIPCNAAAITATENKEISNIIAQAAGLNVPRVLSSSDQNGIFRPLSFGSSIGVHRGNSKNDALPGIYQEFIPGFDITMPIVYNPENEEMNVLPSIAYIPHTCNPEWFYSAEEKIKDNGFDVYPMTIISHDLEERILSFIKKFPITTYGRIDARIKTQAPLSKNSADVLLNLSDFYFVEVNSMPTIEVEDSFEYSLNSILANPRHSFYSYANYYFDTVSNPSIHGFLLSCSILSVITKC